MVNELNGLGSSNTILGLRSTSGRGLRLDLRLSGEKSESTDAARVSTKILIRNKEASKTEESDILEELKKAGKGKKFEEGTLSAALKELTSISDRILGITDKVLGSESPDGRLRRQDIQELEKEFKELVASDGFNNIRERVSTILKEIKAGRKGVLEDDSTVLLLGTNLVNKLRKGDATTAENLLKNLDRLASIAPEGEYPSPDDIAEVSSTLQALTGSVAGKVPQATDPSRFVEALNSVLTIARRGKHSEYRRAEDKNLPETEKALDKDITDALNELKGIASSKDFALIVKLVNKSVGEMMEGRGRNFAQTLERQFKDVVGKEFISLLKNFEVGKVKELAGVLGRIQSFGQSAPQLLPPEAVKPKELSALLDKSVTEKAGAEASAALGAPAPAEEARRPVPRESEYAGLIEDLKHALSVLKPKEIKKEAKDGDKNAKNSEKDPLAAAKESLMKALTQKLHTEDAAALHLLSPETVKTLVVDR